MLLMPQWRASGNHFRIRHYYSLFPIIPGRVKIKSIEKAIRPDSIPLHIWVSFNSGTICKTSLLPSFSCDIQQWGRGHIPVERILLGFISDSFFFFLQQVQWVIRSLLIYHFSSNIKHKHSPLWQRLKTPEYLSRSLPGRSGTVCECVYVCAHTASMLEACLFQNCILGAREQSESWESLKITSLTCWAGNVWSPRRLGRYRYICGTPEVRIKLFLRS